MTGHLEDAGRNMKRWEYNRNYKQLLRDGKYDEAEGFSGRSDRWNRSCLQGSNRSRTFVRIDWYGNVLLYPHEI